MPNICQDLIDTFGTTRQSQFDAVSCFVSQLEAQPDREHKPRQPGFYPLDAQGYAQAFDPVLQMQEFLDAWDQFGFVVGRAVVDQSTRQNAVQTVKTTASRLSDGQCNLDDPSTFEHMPVDNSGVALLTRGFFELYHDDALAQLRQSLRLYVHHSLLWGSGRLWTTFDRFGVKLPSHVESAALPLHVDQNPDQHPGFRTIQGILALEDCPLEKGVTMLAPGSSALFAGYSGLAQRGEYVELSEQHPNCQMLQDTIQPIPIRAGDIVSWDSRTTHANTANVSDQTRYVALVATGLAKDDQSLMQRRQQAFATAEAVNVRDAYMHASKKPRYTDASALAQTRSPEKLTVLGEMLYGTTPYPHIAQR